jgi:hypothetical protein
MPLAVTFGESVVLLLITAALTGVLAPIVVGFTSHRRLIQQRHFEEELRRETAFIDAQAEFLKELAAAVWDYFEKALAVSYAGAHSPGRFEQVWEAYEEEALTLMGRIGARVYIARTLVSTTTADRLEYFYSRWLQGEFDVELSRMARDEATSAAEWRDWHGRMLPVARTTAGGLIKTVAEDAGLSYEQRRERPAPVHRLRRLKHWLARRGDAHLPER